MVNFVMSGSPHPHCLELPLQPSPTASWIVITHVAARVGREEKLRPCHLFTHHLRATALKSLLLVYYQDVI